MGFHAATIFLVRMNDPADRLITTDGESCGFNFRHNNRFPRPIIEINLLKFFYASISNSVQK